MPVKRAEDVIRRQSSWKLFYRKATAESQEDAIATEVDDARITFQEEGLLLIIVVIIEQRGWEWGFLAACAERTQASIANSDQQ